MNRISLLTGCALVALASGCKTADPRVADLAPTAQLRSGVQLEALDRSTDPRDDFYQFVNGGWLDTTEIPEIYSGYTVYHVVRESVEVALRDIVERAAAEGGPQGRSAISMPAGWMSSRSTRWASNRCLTNLKS